MHPSEASGRSEPNIWTLRTSFNTPVLAPDISKSERTWKIPSQGF